MDKEQKSILMRIVISILMLIGLNFIPMISWLRIILYMATYLIIGFDILKEAGLGVIKGKVFDENFLMAVATIGSIVLAIYEKSSEFNESIAVMLFYQIGELFQDYAVDKSKRNISNLMDIRPDYANIEEDGRISKVDPNKVSIGSTIVVQPGEKIPIEGIVVEGNSFLDMSALTGESVPKKVEIGNEVISGCINMEGLIKVKTTKEFGESTVSKIIELVEKSSENKSKSENFITKFARVYTPVVCIMALVLAIVPPTIDIFLNGTSTWLDWIYRALTFLVISCPCALVVSIPLSFFAGIGGAGKEGILIKGSNFMEILSKINVVVFDKTGTLTQGVFEVKGVHHNKIEDRQLLEYAALAESSSSHPISKSLQRAYGKEIDRNRIKDVKEISGHGLIAKVDEVEVCVGNEKLMEMIKVPYEHCHSVGTIIHVAIDKEYMGHIVISDIEKPTSKQAILELKKIGIDKTIMLTGDSKEVAKKVAEDLNVDEAYGEMLPNDKVLKLEEILKENSRNSKLAFVGDGINDAPVLSRADIGIAMGAVGSDAAIEAADVVLMDDDPLKISKGIKISKKCLAIVYENITFALVVKFLCLGFGAFGIANMWLAIFADVGVTVIAIINAIRALNVKRL